MASADSAPKGPVDTTGQTLETSEEVETFDSYDDMGLEKAILQGIYAYNWESPSTIQKQAIVPIIKGRDVIAQAQAGTGKTGTFVIGALSRIDIANVVPQVLILAPNRELAEQICKVTAALGSQMEGLKVAMCIGGTRVQENIETLRGGVHIVAGTPGRVYDMINRGALSTANLKILVLDEADHMLDRGFKEQIYEIFKLGLPETMQVVLTSATMPAEALEITQKFMTKPLRLLLKEEEVKVDSIKQYFVSCPTLEAKVDTVKALFQAMSLTSTIIFCNTKRVVDQLSTALTAEGYQVSASHADLEGRQDARAAVLSSFRSGASRVLITTDMLARGIDVQQVQLVINFDIPNNRENYMHRVGRAGRFGRKGQAINLVLPGVETEMLAQIQQTYGVDIEELAQGFEAELSGMVQEAGDAPASS